MPHPFTSFVTPALCAASVLLSSLTVQHSSAADLTLEQGDHIVFVGNALAERMQHDGWFESYVQFAMADKRLVFRNHGFSGDQVDKRPRQQGLRENVNYMELSKPDVVIGFFGYNESYGNNADGFQAKVEKWVTDTKSKDYSGRGAPQVVLVSPIAHEDLGGPYLNDGTDNNKRLAAYTQALKQAAAAKSVPFVDLFAVTQKAYDSNAAPLTINGIHLTSEGNRLVARAMYSALFGGQPRVEVGDRRFDAIRAAVIDKNWHWYKRYRATDGNDIWGSRSKKHKTVLMHELAQLDVMTANRDEHIHALAQGKSHKIDDSNVPPAMTVETNYKADNAKLGALEYPTPQEALMAIKLEDGLEANVFASEVMFPELKNPVAMSLDTKGRMWVATWGGYPRWMPGTEMDDRLLILPDENRDGVADKAITFAKISNPLGFEFWNGGVIVASQPTLWFLKDTDGDDVADVKIPILHGLGSSDTHHAANSFKIGPAGNLYFLSGIFLVNNVESPWRSNIFTDSKSGMYRFNPRTYEFDFHVAYGANPHGMDFMHWGSHVMTNGNTGQPNHVRPNFKNPDQAYTRAEMFKKTMRPVPQSAIMSSDHFPEKFQGQFMIANVIGYRGLKRYTLNFNKGNGFYSGDPDKEIEMLWSENGNFRPSDMDIGDDGSLYVADWCNALIGHMQHHIRDPSRDHVHGRIFRVTAKGRPLSKHVPIDGQAVSALLKLLEHPVANVRYRARIELSEHDREAILPALDTWSGGLDPKKDLHALTEAMWMYAQLEVETNPVMATVAQSADIHAQNAAKDLDYLTTEARRIARSEFAHDHAPSDDLAEGLELTSDKELTKRGFDKNGIKRYKRGAEIYIREGMCGTCHQADGNGLKGTYPPLLDNEWVGGDPERLIKLTLNGLMGPIEVNGKPFNEQGNLIMTGFGPILNDEEIASVLTYVRNTFGNNYKPISGRTVGKVRAALDKAGKQSFYNADELLGEHPFDSGERKANSN